MQRLHSLAAATMLASAGRMPAGIAFAPRAQTPDPAEMVRQIQANMTTNREAMEARFTAIEAAIDAAGVRSAADRLGGAGAVTSAIITPEVAASFVEGMRGRPSAAMTSQSDPDGGFTVPRQVDGTILNLMRALSPMRQLATIATLATGNTWTKIVNRVGTGTAWAGEEDDRTITGSPKLGEVNIPVSEIYAQPALTNEILADSSFNLQAFLAEDVAGEFAIGEGSAFITGNGNRKPLGILARATNAKPDATREFGIYQHIVTGTDGALGGTQMDMLVDLITALRAPYRRDPSTAWLMNSTTAAMLRKLKDGNGNYLWAPAIAQGQQDYLLGYPVAIDEGMPDMAKDACPIAFGAWKRGYAVVDRMGVTVIVDRVTRKGWTNLYFAKRVGGAPLDTNAIKFLKFSAK